jgi:soluble lytic murein transglycosylase-like protein
MLGAHILMVGLALTLPAPSAPIPTSARPLAATLIRTERSLDEAIDRWDKSTNPPHDVTLLALYEQRIIRVLGEHPALARSVVKLDPKAADDVAARVDLRALVASGPVPRVSPRVGPARPADLLLAWYREAQRRFHVCGQLLAAVNFVESAFGRMRNTSTAGAQGPMQFIPSTWASYGMGGNIRHPHDAILAAANYLRASGAPRDVRRALYAYNPSPHYVNAVLAYADRIRRDRRSFFSYYASQVYVRTTAGTRRITGPGL